MIYNFLFKAVKTISGCYFEKLGMVIITLFFQPFKMGDFNAKVPHTTKK